MSNIMPIIIFSLRREVPAMRYVGAEECGCVVCNLIFSHRASPQDPEIMWGGLRKPGLELDAPMRNPCTCDECLYRVQLHMAGTIDKTQRAKLVLHAECPERNIMFQSDDDTVSWPRLKTLYIYTPHCAGPSFDTLHFKRAKSKRVPPKRAYPVTRAVLSAEFKQGLYDTAGHKSGKLAPRCSICGKSDALNSYPFPYCARCYVGIPTHKRAFK